ncbi:MAG: RidA family protein [Trueperaceae bacterium]|nr:RidA family protein [Trueperaceae bacterium]
MPTPTPIHTDRAPQAIGPYVQAVRVGDLVFTSGSIPLDLDGNLVEGDVRVQTEQAMANLAAVLEAAGTSLAFAVKTTCFLADMNDFAAFNEVYARWVGDAKPARSTVQVARLPKDARVEVECVAALPGA